MKATINTKKALNEEGLFLKIGQDDVIIFFFYC